MEYRNQDTRRGAVAWRWLTALVLVASGAATGLEAGAAKADITPPLGTPLNGYGARMGRGAIQVHDPITVRCLYLNDGETAVLLVTSDLCAINRELRQRVLELAPREIRPENIILTATHTHSAQGAMIRSLIFRAVSGRFMPEILEQTARGFADAMQKAIDGRKRGAIGYGTGEQRDLSTNRRYDKGPIDPQIGVIRVDDGDGNPVAIVANLAAHPTTVSDDDLLTISADYPGYFYARLEELAGPGCVAMFMNGAEGNQRPTNPENKPDPWARTESIGRLLAERVKGIADAITCGDRKLHAGYATPELPPSNASTIVFPSTTLQTLEFHDLLVTFVPGEACVEIGLGLRTRALDRGYATQFTVGLANDYMGYFVPIEYYPQLHYESAMNFYGPCVSDWLYREFSKLMTRGEPEKDRPVAAAASPEPLASARRVALHGTPYEIGCQRGAAFRDEIAAHYKQKLVDPMEAGALLPAGRWWKMLSPYFNTTPIALFVLGIGARPLLQGISKDAFEEVEGMADGAGLPFDALWLLQAHPVIAAQPDVSTLYRAPFCTMFASVGDRAGADDVLVGRNLDWPDDDPPVLIEVAPATGRRFVHLGFTWNVGAFTGMNDAGLVLCAERIESLGAPPIDGAPVEFVLRDLLQTTDTVEAAVAQLQAHPKLRGYHVLVAGAQAPWAAVVEFGTAPVVRQAAKGFLLGADPGSKLVDDASKARYARLVTLLGGEHIIAAGKMKSALADQEPGQSGACATIWNERTRYSVLLEPKTRTLRVAFRDAGGRPGEYTTLRLTAAEERKKGRR